MNGSLIIPEAVRPQSIAFQTLPQPFTWIKNEV